MGLKKVVLVKKEEKEKAYLLEEVTVHMKQMGGGFLPTLSLPLVTLS